MDARQALADLDAQYTTARQVRVAEDTARNVRTVAHVQTMVEYIEVVLVSVYAAHLWDMIEPHIHSEWLHETLWIMPRGSWGVLLIALVAGGITALVLKPWRHRQHHAGDDTLSHP
jgi:hypothetical protein